METNTTKEKLIEEFNSGVIETEKKALKAYVGGGNGRRLLVQVIGNIKERAERKITQAHTAGRNAEREKLREMVEGMEKPVDWEYTDTYNFDLYAGYRQALTDIKNHLA